MACFLVPLGEAVITSVVTKIVEKKEKEPKTGEVRFDGDHAGKAAKIPFSRKLKWLNYMLYGGSFLLAFEHVWHGEVVPFFPFLTAASDPAEASAMLHEMATAGVLMAALVTAAWLLMLAGAAIVERRALADTDKAAAKE